MEQANCNVIWKLSNHSTTHTIKTTSGPKGIIVQKLVQIFPCLKYDNTSTMDSSASQHDNRRTKHCTSQETTPSQLLHSQVPSGPQLSWPEVKQCKYMSKQNSLHHGAYLLGTSKVPSRTKILIIVPLHIWSLAQNLYEWCLLLGVPLTACESASTWPVIPHTSISDRVDILVSLLLTPLGIPQGVRLHATMTTSCSFPDMNQALTL